MPSSRAPALTAAGTEMTLNVEAGGKVSAVSRERSGVPRPLVGQAREVGSADATGEDGRVVGRVAGGRHHGTVRHVEDDRGPGVGAQLLGSCRRDGPRERGLGAGLEPGVEVGHEVATRPPEAVEPTVSVTIAPRVDGDDRAAVRAAQHRVVLRLEPGAPDDVLGVDAPPALAHVVGAGPRDPAEQVGGEGAVAGGGRRARARS